MYLGLLIASICIAVPAVVTSFGIFDILPDIHVSRNTATTTPATPTSNTIFRDSITNLFLLIVSELNNFAHFRIDGDTTNLPHVVGIPLISNWPVTSQMNASEEDLYASYLHIFSTYERAVGYVVTDESYCKCNQFKNHFMSVHEKAGDLVTQLQSLINSTGLTNGTDLSQENEMLVPFPPTPNETVRSERDYYTLDHFSDYLSDAQISFDLLVDQGNSTI